MMLLAILGELRSGMSKVVRVRLLGVSAAQFGLEGCLVIHTEGLEASILRNKEVVSWWSNQVKSPLLEGLSAIMSAL